MEVARPGAERAPPIEGPGVLPDRHRVTTDDGRSDARQVVGPLDRPPLVPAHLIDRREPAYIARGGDDWLGSQDLGDPVRQLIGPRAMPPEHADGEPTRVIDHHHGRISALIQSERAGESHNDSQGHDRDDRIMALPDRGED